MLFKRKWAWTDSNRQPSNYELPALTIELQALVFQYIIPQITPYVYEVILPCLYDLTSTKPL